MQATENTSVSSTDEVWANVTLPVATIAGQANPSRQSLERGAPGVDRLVMNDLAGAYGVALDQQCLSGSGASGQVLGVFNTAGVNQATAFTAAATPTTFWSKVADGPAYGDATAGQTFMGMRLVVDANVPTAVGTGPEDQALVYRADDILLYENDGGMPTELRFGQTLANQLTITLVSFGYLAFTAGRYPSAVGIVGGNAGTAGFGLVNPSF